MSVERDDVRNEEDARREAVVSKRQSALDLANALALLTYPARLWLASSARPHLEHPQAAVIHYLGRRTDRRDLLS